MPMNQTLYQFAAVQLVVVICELREMYENTFGRDSTGVCLLFLTSVVHLEVVELQFLVAHFAGVDGDVHVFGNVTKTRESES
jgi:hypothetical protein